MAIAATTLPGPQDGDEGDGEQHRRQHQDHVEHARDRGVHPAAEVAGEQAERHRDERARRATAEIETARLARRPWMTRLSTSRPSTSDPNGCAGAGRPMHLHHVHRLRVVRARRGARRWRSTTSDAEHDGPGRPAAASRAPLRGRRRARWRPRAVTARSCRRSVRDAGVEPAHDQVGHSETRMKVVAMARTPTCTIG